MRFERHLLLLGIFLCLAFSSLQVDSCVNERGESVEWFAAFRIPGSRRYSIWDTESGPFRELPDETIWTKLFDGINLNKDSVAMWNDDRPEFKTTENVTPAIERILQRRRSRIPAHDKAVMYRKENSSNGFFLLHSVPKFPAIIDRERLDPVTPEGSIYGQSFICVSLNSEKSYETLYEHLQLQMSDVYFNNFGYEPLEKPSKDDSKASFIDDANKFELVTKGSYSSLRPFEDVLMQKYSTGWLMETWGRPYSDNTEIDGKKIINNQKVKWHGEIFKRTKDHSKYALALDKENFLCIGGMNHMDSQTKRGGQFICFENANLYYTLRHDVMQPLEPERPKSLKSLLK